MGISQNSSFPLGVYLRYRRILCVSCVDTPPPTLTAFYAVHCQQHNWERGHHHLSYLPLLRARCDAQVYNTAGEGGVHPPAPPTLPVLPKRYIVCLLFLFYSYLSPLFSLYSFLSYIHFLNVLASGLFPRLLYTRAIHVHTTYTKI